MNLPPPRPTTHPRPPYWERTSFYGDWGFVTPDLGVIKLCDPADGWVSIIAAMAHFHWSRRAELLAAKPPHTDPMRAAKRQEAIEVARKTAAEWAAWLETWKVYWDRKELYLSTR